MQRLKRTYELILEIIPLSPSELVLLLKNLTKAKIDFIREIILNFIKGIYNVPDYIKNRLKRFKNFIRLLSKKKSSLNIRKQITTPRVIKILREILPYAKEHLFKLIEKDD